MGATRFLRRGRPLPAPGAVALPALAQDEGAGRRPRGVARRRRAPGSASVNVNRDALLPVEGVFRFVALDGDSVYETDLQTARASLFYPGEGVIQGPNLACGTFGGQFPPEFKPVLDACLSYKYPLTVRADASDADAATDGAATLGKPTDPMSADAVGAAAHAAADGLDGPTPQMQRPPRARPARRRPDLGPPDRAAEGRPDGAADRQRDEPHRPADRSRRARRRRAESKLVRRQPRRRARADRLASCRRPPPPTTATGKRTAAADIEVSGVTVARRPRRRSPRTGSCSARPPALGPIKQQVQQAANQLLAHARACGSACSTTSRPPTTAPGWPERQAPGLLVEVTTRADGAARRPRSRSATSTSTVTYVGHDPARRERRVGRRRELRGRGDRRRRSTPSIDVPVDAGFVPTDAGIVRHRRHRRRRAAPAAPTAGARRPRSSSSAGSSTRFGGRLGLLYLAFALHRPRPVPRASPHPARPPPGPPLVNQGALHGHRPVPPRPITTTSRTRRSCGAGSRRRSARGSAGSSSASARCSCSSATSACPARRCPAKQIPYLVSGGIGGMFLAVARRLLPRHPGAAQGQRPARPARADGRGAAPGAAAAARRPGPDRPARRRRNGDGSSAPARKVVAVRRRRPLPPPGLLDGRRARTPSELTPAAARKRGLRPCPLCTPAPSQLTAS